MLIEILMMNGIQTDLSWLSLLPALVVLLLALLTRKVLLALIAGIFTGILVLHGVSFQTIVFSWLMILEGYILSVLQQSDHISIILFTIFTSVTLAAVQKSGGVNALIYISQLWIQNRFQALLTTFLSGILLFFDDYTHILVNGSVMKAVSKRFSISSKELSLYIDSLAAPVAAIAFVSTWLGAELSYINQGIESAGINITAFSLFTQAITYAFYPFLLIIVLFTLLFFRPGFHNRLMKDNDLNVNSDVYQSVEKPSKLKVMAGIIPLSILVVVSVIWIYYSGYLALSEEESLTESGIMTIIGMGDPFQALLLASSLSMVTALTFFKFSKDKESNSLLDVSIKGVKDVFTALLILVLAWSLSKILQDTGAAAYTSSLLTEVVSYKWLPFLLCLITGITAFATGTSWGTMAVIFPLAIPLATEVGILQMETGSADIVFIAICVGSVLSGAIFGDHASPVSDTTILSAAVSDCSVDEHFRSQLPYATGIYLFTLCCFFIIMLL